MDSLQLVTVQSTGSKSAHQVYTAPCELQTSIGGRSGVLEAVPIQEGPTDARHTVKLGCLAVNNHCCYESYKRRTPQYECHTGCSLPEREAAIAVVYVDHTRFTLLNRDTHTRVRAPHMHTQAARESHTQPEVVATYVLRSCTHS